MRVYTRAVFCDNGSSICHVDSKGWALPMCVAGAYSPRRFGIDGDHAGSSGDAIQVRRARGAESAPQPNLVPFMPSRSRKTHSKGMSDGASTVWDSPLIFNVTMIDLPTHPRKWSISTRPMLNKIYQTAALCVTGKFVCQ